VIRILFLLLLIGLPSWAAYRYNQQILVGLRRLLAVVVWTLLICVIAIPALCEPLQIPWENAWKANRRRLWDGDLRIDNPEAEQIRQSRSTDAIVSELVKAGELEAVPFSHAQVLDDLRTLGLAHLINDFEEKTPAQLVQQAWDGEITTAELREALPVRQPRPLVTANNALTEKQVREILERHGRPYTGPIQFTPDRKTVLGFDPFDPLTSPSEAPDVGHGVSCACVDCFTGRRFYDRQHRQIDASTYYR
jgi:hypothetical protein